MVTGLIFVILCFKASLCLPPSLEHGRHVKLNLPNSEALAFLYERHKTDVFCLARKNSRGRGISETKYRFAIGNPLNRLVPANKGPNSFMAFLSRRR